MNTRQPLVRISQFVLSTAVLCMYSTISAQPTEGDWTIPTDFGQFVITVANGGTVISTVATTFSSFSCGGITQSGTITSSTNPPPSITDRQFAITQPIGPPASGIFMNIAGTFTESGTEASGAWSLWVSGAICDGTWGPIVINVSIDDVDGEIPEGFALAQNYPNPFNPSTTIRFDVPQAAKLKLVVYDELGRQVGVLVDGLLPAGEHEVRFDGQSLSSGVYIYRLETPESTFSKTMLLLR